MTYEIKLLEIDDYLKFHCRGERKMETVEKDANNTFQFIADKRDQHQINKFVVISEITGKYPYWAVFEVYSSLDKYGINHTDFIAFVVSENEPPSAIKFCEDTANNFGFNVKFFHTEVSAVEWLRGFP